MLLKNRSNLILLPAITVAAFVLTWISSYQDFSVYDLISIGGICAIVVAFQTLIIVLAARISSNLFFSNAIFALFALFNVYSLHLSFINSITALESYIQASLAVVGLYIFFTLKEISDKSKANLIVTCGAILILVIINASSTWQTNHSNQFTDQKEFQNTDPKDGQGITSNLRFVKFEEQPNVYIVAFDALMPESLLKSHLDLDQVPYSVFLKENFYSFQNMFADVVPTRGSLNALLAFDMTYFAKLAIKDRNELFSGNVQSPLTALFKSNGYTINTLYASDYLGGPKGPYIDNYFIGLPFTVCEFIDGKARSIAFMGFCTLEDTYFFQTQISYWGPLKHLLASFEQQLKYNKPQFFLAYLFSPGHTKLDFKSNNQADIEKYRQLHMKNSSEAADMIKQLKEFVDRSGGRDILVVMGDHGPFLSRTLKFTDNPNFYIRDRYGIYGGVYPRDRCKSYFDEADILGYNTPSIVLQTIIRCLSGGNDPFIVPQTIVGPLGAPPNITYEKLKYE